MERRTLFLLAPLLSCLLLSARAETTETTALSNGLRVIVRQQHARPLVALDLWVRAGAREERHGEGGCAHFLEHTLFRGTRGHPPGDVDEEIEDLGATLDAATGPDYARLYTTVAASHYKQALGILADVVRNATLPDAAVDSERGVILDELAGDDQDPENLLVNRLYAEAFPDGAYSHSPGGAPAAIAERGRDTIAGFYARCYRPDRCILVIAGDCDTQQALAAARKAFGDWTPVPAVPNALAGTVPRARLPAPAADLKQGAAGCALIAPPASDRVDAAAARIAAALLGASGGGGRLAAIGPADAALSARYVPRQDSSLFLLLARLPGNAGERDARAAQNLLMSAFRSLASNPPGPDELESAKMELIGRAEFDTETDSGMARALGYAAVTGGDDPEEAIRRIQSIGPAELRQFTLKALSNHLIRAQITPGGGDQ